MDRRLHRCILFYFSSLILYLYTHANLSSDTEIRTRYIIDANRVPAPVAFCRDAHVRLNRYKRA